jgi:hypothetical protein
MPEHVTPDPIINPRSKNPIFEGMPQRIHAMGWRFQKPVASQKLVDNCTQRGAIAVAGGNTLAQLEPIAAPSHSETLARAFTLAAVVRQILQRHVQQIKRTYSWGDYRKGGKSFICATLTSRKICENGGGRGLFHKLARRSASHSVDV